MGIIPRRNTVCRTPPTCHNTCTDPVACWADPRGRWSCGHQYHRESSTWPAPLWSSTAGPGGSDTCPLPGINSVSCRRISLCDSPTLVCSRDADVGIKATLPSLALTMQIFSRESWWFPILACPRSTEGAPLTYPGTAASSSLVHLLL